MAFRGHHQFSLFHSHSDEDKAQTDGSNGIFIPVLKSRTLGSDIDYNLNEKDQKWDLDPHTASGGSLNEKREGASNASSSSPTLSPLQKTLPEQLKVFKGDDRSGCQPTSPKNRRMLYSGSTSNGSRPSFPGSLFPLESSPRHQRKALNISEPFAVSVPLRVSAVINSNSTPCRAPGKERDRGLGGLFKPTKEAGPLEAHGSESIGTAGFHVPSRSSSGNFMFTDWETGLAGHSSSTGFREHLLSDSSGGSGCSIYSNSSSFPVENEDQTGERDTTDVLTLGTTKSMTIVVCVRVCEHESIFSFSENYFHSFSFEKTKLITDIHFHYQILSDLLSIEQSHKVENNSYQICICKLIKCQ